MGIFNKKKDKETKQLLENIDGKQIEYCSERDKNTYVETVLGKIGRISVNGDELLIMCDAHEVFRCGTAGLRGGEFLSHDGVTLNGVDKNTGAMRSIVAYYKYYRK
jgi:hypothetical protein